MNSGNKILLISDDALLARYLSEELINHGGYSVRIEASGRAGLEAFLREGFDLVLVKAGIPDIDSAELNRRLKNMDPDCLIVACVEGPDLSNYPGISDLGFYDFIFKPVNLERVSLIVKKGTELHAALIANRKVTSGLQEQNLSLQKQNALLAKRIEESSRNLSRLYDDLRSTYLRTVKAFAQAIDARDHYTHSHSENVAKYAVAIAEQMHLVSKEIEVIREACELHDLGKIGVNDNILTKPTSLNDEEWIQIKKHPQMAVQILKSLPFLDGVIDLVKQHHENYDGSGYPGGLRGDEILLGARIIHLADAYEAMRTPRSYRPIPLLKDEAIAEIKKNVSKQFDPKVVEEFLKIIDKLEGA
jgi:putative nucleotidyltransferase with HDIG domain